MAEAISNAGMMDLTDRAAGRIREMIEGEGNPDLKLRVFIQGGGCSGFQYGFNLESAAKDDDLCVDRDGITVLVDPMSFQYLMGAQIDYQDDLQGARFIVNNPNANTTCGCGSSFGV